MPAGEQRLEQGWKASPSRRQAAPSSPCFRRRTPFQSTVHCLMAKWFEERLVESESNSMFPFNILIVELHKMRSLNCVF